MLAQQHLALSPMLDRQHSGWWKDLLGGGDVPMWGRWGRGGPGMGKEPGWRSRAPLDPKLHVRLKSLIRSSSSLIFLCRLEETHCEACLGIRRVRTPAFLGERVQIHAPHRDSGGCHSAFEIQQQPF